MEEKRALQADIQEDARTVRPYSKAVSQLRSSIGVCLSAPGSLRSPGADRCIARFTGRMGVFSRAPSEVCRLHAYLNLFCNNTIKIIVKNTNIDCILRQIILVLQHSDKTFTNYGNDKYYPHS